MNDMLQRIVFLVVVAMISSSPAFSAPPHRCVGDDANGRLSFLRGKECNTRCLAVAAKNAPRDSAAIMIGMDKMPREMNAKCVADDGSPGVAGHGTGCFPLKTLRFITPCNMEKDLYDISE
jgi:hypothetical protein